MLKSRLASTTKKVNLLNAEIERVIPGVKALEQANYESFAKEEGKIIISIETIGDKIQSLEQELLVFEQAEEDIQNNVDQTKKYEAQIEKILDSLEKGREVWALLKAHKVRLSALKPASTNQTTQPEQMIQSRANEVKTPKVKIPKFKGVKWEWHNFYAIFEEIVGKSDLSPLLKLNTLVNQLEGEAKELVAGYQMNNENYEKVIDVLKNRYANKTDTINELNDRLINAKATDFKTSAQRKLWDSVRTILEQLKILKQDEESEMMKNLVVKKFNYTIQEGVYREKLELDDDSKWTMDKIKADLETTIKRCEYLDAQLGRDKGRADKKSKDEKRPNHGKNSKSDEVHTDSKRTRCRFCESNDHFSYKCPKVSTIEERLKILNQKDACKGCFRINPKHEKNECDLPYLCKNDCKEKHNLLLCPKKKSSGESKKTKNNQPVTQTKAHANTTSAQVTLSQTEKKEAGSETEKRQGTGTSASPQESYLATLKTEAFNRKKEEWDTVSILIDCGASRTFISSELMEQFNLPAESTVTMDVQVFGDEIPRSKTYQRTKIKLKLPDEVIEAEVLATDVLAGTMKKAPLSKEDTIFILRNGFKINEDSLETSVRPNIILGTDVLKKIWKGTMVELPSGITLVQTVLGGATLGQADREKMECIERKENDCGIIPIFVSHASETKELDAVIERDIEDRQRNDMSMKTPEEFAGPLTDEKVEMERKTIEFFKNTIEKRPKGYFVRLPFKDDELIPDNRPIAMKRLISVKKYHSEEVLKQIDDIFQDQLEKEIIEPVENEKQWSGRLHYNPHQPVITPLKTTTKCRVVIDGSSHFKNEKSLNDIIGQGPVILPDLTEMLVRFRSGQTVILSDVEKAFLQVHLHEEDRDVTRVLWLKDYRKPVTEDNIVAYRFTRVIFGLNVSPYLLGATIEHHLQNHTESELAEEISKNLYVDNLILTTDGDVVEATKLYRNSKNTFNEMQMNLREFLSNSAEFNRMVDEKDRAKESNTKVLGVKWSAENDKLEFGINVTESEEISRRIVASTIAGIFDPLGMLVPILLPMKLFQRNLWNETYEWDTPLSDNHQEEWRKIVRTRNGFKKFLERHAIRKTGENELVMFTDASKEAIACCIYVLVNQEAKLIIAKSKVKPLKESWTIPKLETQAIATGVQLLKKTLRAMTEGKITVSEINIMSDSEIALAWLRTQPTKQEVGVLVSNRLRSIRETVNGMSEHCPVYFGYVETKINPADLGTRGIDKEAAEETLWWVGPEFLRSPKELWPHRGSFFQIESQDAIRINMINGTEPKEERELVFNYERTNSLPKLKRIAAYVLKFVNRLKRALEEDRRTLMDQRIPELTHISDGELSGSDIEKAMWILIKDTQRQFSEKDLKKLRNLRPKRNSNGIIVCPGRMERSELPTEAKEPVLMTAEGRLSTLMILEAHGKYHKSVEHTMSEVRRTTWIPKLRAKTKSILKKCVACQRLTKQPFRYPNVGQLPSYRVNESYPFETNGLDYFGPIPYRMEDGSIGKAYGAIFTCAATRLVHVEIVPNETTTAFIQAFRKFVALRGVPKRVVSDNAPTFILGCDIITEVSRGQSLTNEVKEMLQIMEIDWSFITPYAPWKGGFYERMVKTVKSAFKKGIGRTILTIEELSTTFYEVTASINSRPLTHEEDDLESTRAIRPNDFIYQHFRSTLQMEELLDQDQEYRPSKEAQAALTRTETIEALKSSTETTAKIWKIWKEKYLAELRETHKLKIDNKRGHPAKPRRGQLVVVCDEDQPRDVWRLGRITELIESEDGEIREVHLLVKSQLRKAHIIKRPPNLLVPLELSMEDEQVDDASTKIEPREEPIIEEEVQNDSTPRYNLRQRTPRNYNEEPDVFAQVCSTSWKTWSLITIVTLISLCMGQVTGANQGENGIECTKTGVKLLQEYENFEICVKDYCTSRTRMQWTLSGPTDVWIPIALKTRPHRASVKVLKDGEIKVYEKNCPAVNTCEAIDCTFCFNNIFNPECSPMWAWIGLGGLLYCIGMLIYCCCQIPIKLGGPIMIWWRILRAIFRTIVECCRKDEQDQNETQDRKKKDARRPSWTWRIKESMVIFTILISVAKGCEEIELLTQATNECVARDGKESCQVVTNSIVHLNQIQREACIRMKSNGTTFQEIRAKFVKTNLRCLKESVTFTKNAKIKIWSVKRCAHMGSCTDTKCAKIHQSSYIPELDQTYNYTGTTGCVESCGGPGCDCFFPSSACMFYRIYAETETDEIYEIFRCIQWDASMLIELTTTTMNSRKNMARKEFIELRLNEPLHVGNKSLTASVITTTPSPILNSWFIRKGTETATWSNTELPSFQCFSEARARQGDCQLRPRCDCHPAETEMRCVCQQHNLTTHFNTIQRRLPIQKGHWKLTKEDSSVIAGSDEKTSTELVIRTRGDMEIDILREEDRCEIEAGHIIGCYSCAEGGHVNLTCKSRKRTTIATLSCGDRLYTVTCSLKGHQQELNLFSDRAQFHERCFASCGDEKTEFQITGILKYTGSIWTSMYDMIEGKTTIYNELNLPDVFHLFDGFMTFFKTGMIVLIAVAVIFATTYLTVFSCCAKLARKTIWVVIKLPFTVIRTIVSEAMSNYVPYQTAKLDAVIDRLIQIRRDARTTENEMNAKIESFNRAFGERFVAGSKAQSMANLQRSAWDLEELKNKYKGLSVEFGSQLEELGLMTRTRFLYKDEIDKELYRRRYQIDVEKRQFCEELENIKEIRRRIVRDLKDFMDEVEIENEERNNLIVERTKQIEHYGQLIIAKIGNLERQIERGGASPHVNDQDLECQPVPNRHPLPNHPPNHQKPQIPNLPDRTPNREIAQDYRTHLIPDHRERADQQPQIPNLPDRTPNREIAQDYQTHLIPDHRERADQDREVRLEDRELVPEDRGLRRRDLELRPEDRELVPKDRGLRRGDLELRPEDRELVPEERELVHEDRERRHEDREHHLESYAMCFQKEWRQIVIHNVYSVEGGTCQTSAGSTQLPINDSD
ncbi:unnamed protein product [Caenorhabditis nigoni]